MVHYTALMAFKNKTWVHKLSIILTFSNPHRVKGRHTGSLIFNKMFFNKLHLSQTLLAANYKLLASFWRSETLFLAELAEFI